MQDQNENPSLCDASKMFLFVVFVFGKKQTKNLEQFEATKRMKMMEKKRCASRC